MEPITIFGMGLLELVLIILAVIIVAVVLIYQIKSFKETKEKIAQLEIRSSKSQLRGR